MLNELIGSLVQVLLFSLLPFLVWLISARKKESFFQWIGLKKPVCQNTKRILLVALVIAIIYIMAMNLCMKLLPEGIPTAGSQFAGQGMAALPAVLAFSFFRTALAEEILFRGFLLKRLQNKFVFLSANTLQAAAFGLMHGIPLGLVTKSAAVFTVLTLLPGAFGWYQGWLNERHCGGSIIPSWLLHGCINFLSGIVSLL